MLLPPNPPLLLPLVLILVPLSVSGAVRRVAIRDHSHVPGRYQVFISRFRVAVENNILAEILI